MSPDQPPQQPTPANPFKLDPHPDHNNIRNPLAAMREGEVNLFEVKRHSIGLVGVYATFGFLLLIVAAVALAAPSLLPNYDAREIHLIGSAVFLFALLFSLLFAYIARVVYKGNKWILTSDSLTQVTQTSLFNKQSSQLSLGNLEDVTAQQDGILPHMFNYGILKVETAGERSKFQFPFCPNPNSYAQQILVAREAFEQGKWYGTERPDNRSQDGQGPQPGAPTAGSTGLNINSQ